MSNRFHINFKGDVRPCRATKRACQFDEHFSNEKDAQKRSEQIIGKKHRDVLKSIKGKSSPDLRRTATLKDLKDDLLSPEEEANVFLFEAIKKSGFMIGEHKHQYYGRSHPEQSDELKSQLEAIGLTNSKNSTKQVWSTQDLWERGLTIDLVSGSLKEEKDSTFNGTFSPPANKYFVQAKAVLRNATKGVAVVVPVEAEGAFSEFVNETIAESRNFFEVHSAKSVGIERRLIKIGAESENRQEEDSYARDRSEYRWDDDDSDNVD